MRHSLVSVIVATRDRPDILHECLDRLCAQASGSFEVIVVDNSTNGAATLRVVEAFPAVYARADSGSRNPAQMRNQGISMAQGELLGFIDDDTMVTSSWLDALTSAFADPQVGGIVGRVIEAGVPSVSTDQVGRFSPRGELTMNYNNTIDSPVEVDFLYGCNMAVRRQALQRAGMYDPWFGITYEEQDLSFRIHEAGYRLLYAPDMVARHLKAPRPAGVVQRSESFDLRSQFISCRSLAYLCVSHFGVRRDFAQVAFFNLPKGAARSFLACPSLTNLLKIPAVLLGGAIGYGMAGARLLGLHGPDSLPESMQ